MISKLFKRITGDATSHSFGGKANDTYNGPVDVLITDGHLVTFDEANTMTPSGAVAIKDGKIVAIGADLGGLADRAEQIISAKDRIVMPGLINTHCHAGDSLFRGLVEGLALEPWLEKLWVAESAILNAQTIELGSILGYAENLLNGVTTVMDMFWQPAALVEGAHKSGIRVATGGIFFDPPGIDGLTGDQRIAAARQFFDAHLDHPSLINAINAHGAYTVSPESLSAAKALQEEYDALLTIHAAETQAEQKTVQDQYGRSVMRHLNHLGLLGPRTVLAHCVHLDDEEIDIIASTNASVSHNPASNLKLGSGIAPVPAMMDKGVRVALGTDGAVSGNDLDMWKSIRLAATLHNGNMQNPTAVSAQQALVMATRNGATSLGIDHEAGSLELGKRADLIIVNPRQVHAVPVFDPLNYLAFSASNRDVEDVFVAGRHVVKGGKLMTIDIDDVLDRVNAMIPAIRDTIRE